MQDATCEVVGANSVDDLRVAVFVVTVPATVLVGVDGGETDSM